MIFKVYRNILTSLPILLAFHFLYTPESLAQSPPYIQRVYGSPCAGSENVFVFTRTGCTASWYVSPSGAYTLLESSGTYIRLRWDMSVSNATISASYSCTTSGTDYLSFPVVNFTPTISPAGPHRINEGEQATLTASPTGGMYMWFHGGQFVSSNISYAASQPGNYQVSVTKNECQFTSQPTQISVNDSPIVDAGADREINDPSVTVVLTGNAEDSGGNIVSLNWSKISGGSAILTNSSSAALTVSGLSFGTYTFRLTAVDNEGASASDDVIVNVYIPNNYNRIHEIVVLEPGKMTPAEVESLSIGEKAETIQYFDGLGRPIQAVAKQSSPSGLDVVQPFAYDEFGRESFKYLPYTGGTNGFYKENFTDARSSSYTGPSSPQYQFYQTTPQVAIDQDPYAETIFDNSPLNRAIKQGSPGEAWQPEESNHTYSSQDHTVKYSYESNVLDEVVLWSYSNGAISSGSTGARIYYSPNVLFKTKTKDEEKNEVIEFKDKEGRVVLKKVQAPDSEWALTYYIYDDLGNLVVVLSPEAVKALN